MKHLQVVLLICGLMSDPTPIIHLVYKQWIDDGQKSAGKTVIKAMFPEAGLPVPRNLLHNQWINYYNHRQGLIKDTTQIYVPSRWYWFDHVKEKLSCNIQYGNTEMPECTMKIIKPHVTVTKDLLSICHRICQLQAVRDLDILGIRCVDLPEPHVFTLSKNTELIKIINCELSIQTLRHLVQQINRCSTLRVLDLSFSNPTGCLSSFLPDPHPGLPELEELNLRGTALNIKDLQQLSHIIQSNKLPKLRKLKLSSNILTGCLSRFLAYPHPGLPELEKLNLRMTRLYKEDLQLLSHITQSNKLPKVEVLDLSYNTLTGCLSSFLPDPHPGLPELEKLILEDTELNKEDLQHLSHLIQTHKLPGLKNLDLSFNRLYEMETDVEHLIEAYATQHQRKLNLWLWNTGLSEAFAEKWKQRCAETKTELKL